MLFMRILIESTNSETLNSYFKRQFPQFKNDWDYRMPDKSWGLEYIDGYEDGTGDDKAEWAYLISTAETREPFDKNYIEIVLMPFDVYMGNIGSVNGIDEIIEYFDSKDPEDLEKASKYLQQILNNPNSVALQEEVTHTTSEIRKKTKMLPDNDFLELPDGTGYAINHDEPNMWFKGTKEDYINGNDESNDIEMTSDEVYNELVDQGIIKENITESVDPEYGVDLGKLRPFERGDWYEYAGANDLVISDSLGDDKFLDPLIYDGDTAEVLVVGDDDNEYLVVVVAIDPEGGLEVQKGFGIFKDAVSEANKVSNEIEGKDTQAIRDLVEQGYEVVLDNFN